jgi:hypothetical protein
MVDGGIVVGELCGGVTWRVMMRSHHHLALIVTTWERSVVRCRSEFGSIMSAPEGACAGNIGTMNIQVNLINCTQTLLAEIADKRMKREDVALTYAMAIKSAAQDAEQPDWPLINKAILARWSQSGLGFIKKRAFARNRGHAKRKIA